MSEKKPWPMPLVEALGVLARAHTRDDELAGFTVSPMADIIFIGQDDYINAWASVRQALGEPVKAPLPPPRQSAA